MEPMTDRPPVSGVGATLWKRWQEVDRLFDAALDLPEDRRESFIRNECGEDAELYRIIADLLEIIGSANSQLEGPGDSLLRAALTDPERPGHGGSRPDSALERPKGDSDSRQKHR